MRYFKKLIIMSKITLSGKCSWFYIIELLHNKRRGFGITGNVKNRLKKGYCIPACQPDQTFDKLYYGNSSQIEALERWLKDEYDSELFIVVDAKCEWIKVNSDLNSISAIQDEVENRIKMAGYKEIYRVKDKHLPFRPSEYFKSVKDDPDFFLEKIT